MTDAPIDEMEAELRTLFASVAPPAAAPAWPDAAPAPRRPAPPMPRRGRWTRRLAMTAAVAVAAGAVVTLTRQGSSQHPPAVPGLPALSVAALPAAAGLDCTLPISALSEDHTTGFIVLDNGRASFRPVHTSGTTYIPGLHRWADVLPQMVAPDGRSYVTEDSSRNANQIHVVDASGDRRVATVQPGFDVMAYTARGVLLMDAFSPPGQPQAQYRVQLRLLDPATGAVRPLPFPGPLTSLSEDMSEIGYLRGANALWLLHYHAATDTASVKSYDLTSGVITDWFDGTADGHGHVEVVGTDPGGQPILQLATADLFHTDPAKRAGIGVRTLVLTAPHRATVLNAGRVGDPGVTGDLSPLSVLDGNLVWLAADDGAIWLLRPSTGLQEVAKVRTSTRGAPGVAISGPCR